MNSISNLDLSPSIQQPACMTVNEEGVCQGDPSLARLGLSNMGCNGGLVDKFDRQNGHYDPLDQSMLSAVSDLNPAAFLS